VIFVAIAELLETRGALLRGGTIIDATLIAASPSTKNKAQKRDPEMRSSKKGNHFLPFAALPQAAVTDIAGS
jgi:hypothetical protein